MEEIKNDKQLLIELRNKIAGRIVENKANHDYWLYVANKAPHDSQEIIDARKNIELNDDNVKKDGVFLKCIDLMIKKQSRFHFAFT